MSAAAPDGSAGARGPDAERRRRVAIVGGGITGLATAWHLRDDAEVTVYEAATRPGGEIRTVEFADAPMDVGADAFLARHPEAERLARALGLGDEDLVAPATGQVHVWTRGRLRPLPGGTVFGVPTDLREVARSGVLSPAALARATLEPLLPRREGPGDRSVADLVARRFGTAVVDALVEPLLGGVYAGRADRLSTEATVPPVWAAATAHRSLTRGLREHRAGTRHDDRPVFLTVRGGMSRLVTRLQDALGGRVRLATPVHEVEADAAGWRLHTENGPVAYDEVVLAVPPAVAARLLVGVCDDAARELAGMASASVGVVALAYDRDAAATVPAGSGLLVPRSEGRLIKAATFSSRKWPHHGERERFLLRASVGRVDDASALELDDDELADRVDAEVRAATGILEPAEQWFVQRWPAALPQYDVGHRARVERIRHALAARPGLHLGGTALDGLGIAARARDAERLAAAVRTR
ncbi:protoporphyrinogen oxidase [Egicoccus halophilus]|uniref:protoporphyrinogen oxidase n=1 Tax=Egicoccus halophilus TaxID=1670830 RepID=UPI0013EE424F|nr:protoporphyrinogen oxidase [Egicoccus halophilus]